MKRYLKLFISIYSFICIFIIASCSSNKINSNAVNIRLMNDTIQIIEDSIPYDEFKSDLIVSVENNTNDSLVLYGYFNDDYKNYFGNSDSLITFYKLLGMHQFIKDNKNELLAASEIFITTTEHTDLLENGKGKNIIELMDEKSYNKYKNSRVYLAPKEKRIDTLEVDFSGYSLLTKGKYTIFLIYNIKDDFTSYLSSKDIFMTAAVREKAKKLLAEDKKRGEIFIGNVRSNEIPLIVK